MFAPRRGAAARNFRRLLVAALALLLLWGIGLVVFADGIPLKVADTTTKTDAIVVLTGGSKRLETGIELLRDDLAGRLFVSGVYQGLEVRQLLKSVSADPGGGLAGRIEIGNATSTHGNAVETAAWVHANGISSIRLVTGAYHIPRSLLEFHRALPNIRIVPNPVFPERVKQQHWWMWPGTLALTAGEYNKFMLVWLWQRVQDVVLAAADGLRALKGQAGDKTGGKPGGQAGDTAAGAGG